MDWYPEDARALVEPQGYPLTSVPSVAQRIRKVHVGRGSWVFRGTHCVGRPDRRMDRRQMKSTGATAGRSLVRHPLSW
jgi:hypothetical protein